MGTLCDQWSLIIVAWVLMELTTVTWFPKCSRRYKENSVGEQKHWSFRIGQCLKALNQVTDSLIATDQLAKDRRVQLKAIVHQKSKNADQKVIKLYSSRESISLQEMCQIRCSLKQTLILVSYFNRNLSVSDALDMIKTVRPSASPSQRLLLDLHILQQRDTLTVSKSFIQ